MTSVAVGPENDALAAQLADLTALSRAGDHEAALRLGAGLMRDQPPRAVFEAAAAAVVAALAGDALPPGAHEDLLRALIVEDPAGAAPALPLQIAVAHSGGDAKVLPGMARALAPPMAALWGEGHRGRGFLLLALLLRSAPGSGPAGPPIAQEALSRWHHEALAGLGPADMAVPYNAMFDRQSFRRNLADVADLLAQSTAQSLAGRFQPWQIVQLHWISGGGAIDGLLPDLLASALDAAPDAADPAMRALALRGGALGLIPAEVAAAAVAGPSGSGDGAALWCGRIAEWAALRGPDRAEIARALRRLQSKPVQALHAAAGLAAARLAAAGAPMLRLGRRAPRVAVCVSGQLRGWRRALPSWRRGLLQGADCRFFVHAWESIGRSGAEPFRAYLPFEGPAFGAAWRVAANRLGMAEMGARYPALFRALRHGGRVTAAEVAEFYGSESVVLEDDAAARFSGWSNSRKMHYKLAAAHDLAMASGEEFDLVLRLRPDKELGIAAFGWSDLIRAASAPAIFADIPMASHYGHPMIGDQVAMGLPRAMAVYADTLRLAPDLAACGLYGCGPDFAGHTSLALACWHAGIAVERLPVRMGRLLEAANMRPSEIVGCLEADSAGRADDTDRALLGAARADLAASA
ncbi:hypothetical protein [Pseudogemmobacter sonorensis]|uniref:hypothetical protein n=1 Tax=Pseudogemmobacter sonorensis TaxID=2989681 RepID=UPI0036BA179A